MAQLSNQIALRGRSLDFSAFGQLLPNPDPILKAQGKNITTYRDMRTDALVGGCIRRRKSAVKALEWGLDRDQAASRTAKAIEAMLADLDLERIIGQMLDATLYGYQPMEITWQKVGALIVPVDVQAKPPEWFCFDADAQLRFKTRQDPLYGELLPERKFLLPRQDATYQNPYGFADLSMCYWPLLFKKGGMKFWLSFAEKFGSGYLFGTLPRGASNEERATLLDSLEALVANGVGTIPDDGGIDTKELAGKAASADLYEKLVLHSRGEIAIALLGQNQTTEASANKASSVSGLEVTKDLRDGDAELVAAAMNQLIRWTCALNWGDIKAPVWSLWDQKDLDVMQAACDKSNYDAGARYTNAYFERVYNYQAGDLLPEAARSAPTAGPVAPGQAARPSPAFAEGPATPLPGNGADPLQSEIDTLVQHGQPAWNAITAQLQTLVDNATSLPQLQQAMTQAYGGLESDQLVKLMAAALALAELKGMDDARGEVAPSPAFAESAPVPPLAPIAGPAQGPIIFSPEINVNLRIDDIQASLDSALQTMAQAHADKIKSIADTMPIHINLPDQPAPVVNVTVEPPAVSITNTVQPAPITVSHQHPARAVQTVQRNANDEIVSTTTTYLKD